MTLTTLCYIEKDNEYLMLHRVKKERDINKDKWIGIGGHFEKDESPDDCLLREAYEETGLTLTSFRFRGIITFLCDGLTDYHMCLYTADGFTGTMKECSEGTLEWVSKDSIAGLNLWDGDLIFFELLKENAPFFCLKLKYTNNILKEAVLNATPLELLDIVDEQGRSTGKVQERSIIHRYGYRHRAVHIWITRPNTDGGFDVLLRKRAGTQDSCSGYYDVSFSGHIPAGCGYEESALHGLKKELGLTVSSEDLCHIGFCGINTHTEFHGEPMHNNEYCSVYICQKPLPVPSPALPQKEAGSVLWMDCHTCLEKIRDGSIKTRISPEELELLDQV